MEATQQTPAEILKKIRALELKTKGLVQTVFAGDYHSVFKGRGMNFEEVREYQPGDEIRAIDWNVTARLGDRVREEVHGRARADRDARRRCERVGQFRQRRRNRSANSRRKWRACSPSARSGTTTRSGLLLFTDHVELFIPAKKGRSHTLRLIREILFFEPQGRGPIRRSRCNYLNQVVTRRAVVFFISDFQTGDFSRELAVSGRRHDFIAIHVQDEREKVLPNVGIITLEDAETGEQIEINTADRSTRTHFARAGRSARRRS